MKILFSGGGSGGHFYPIIAIIEELRRLTREERLIPPEIFYMAPEPFDARVLFDYEVVFLRVSARRFRRSFSVQAAADIFVTLWSILRSCAVLFWIYPDVVVGKGGYGSFPALFAARLFGIPVLIHESDCVPGRVNRWASSFAERIAIAFPEAADFFPREKVAYTGLPIRSALLKPRSDAPALALSRDKPLIAVIGGSLGSVRLNQNLLVILPEMLRDFEIVHQVGRGNIAEVKARASVLLEKNPSASRYHPIPFLSEAELAEIGSCAELVVSRAGSAIFEIAAWGVPSVLIPLPESSGDHQRANGYGYARTGAALVIEEANLQPEILLQEIRGILGDAARREQMAAAAKRFAKTDAAAVVAREILAMALKHEK